MMIMTLGKISLGQTRSISLCLILPFKCWSQYSPAVVWHQAQGKKLCQCLSLAGWLSTASVLAGLKPCGCHHAVVLLLRTAFSLQTVQIACSSTGPWPVLTQVETWAKKAWAVQRRVKTLTQSATVLAQVCCIIQVASFFTLPCFPREVPES